MQRNWAFNDRNIFIVGTNKYLLISEGSYFISHQKRWSQAGLWAWKRSIGTKRQEMEVIWYTMDLA